MLHQIAVTVLLDDMLDKRSQRLFQSLLLIATPVDCPFHATSPPPAPPQYGIFFHRRLPDTLQKTASNVVDCFVCQSSLFLEDGGVMGIDTLNWNGFSCIFLLPSFLLEDDTVHWEYIEQPQNIDPANAGITWCDAKWMVYFFLLACDLDLASPFSTSCCHLIAIRLPAVFAR